MKKEFKTLQILYLALGLGQTFFAVIAFFLGTLRTSAFAADKNLTLALTIALSIVSISGISMSYFLYRSKITAARTKETATEKMNEFRTACMLRWALLEFPAFLSIIAFMLTANMVFLGGFGIIFFAFLLARPTIEKMAADLELGFDETEELTNSN